MSENLPAAGIHYGFGPFIVKVVSSESGRGAFPAREPTCLFPTPILRSIFGS